MCGIFGYVNHLVPKERREIIDILLKGLSRLEYRGYDSAGIAIDGSFNDEGLLSTHLIKSRGKVAILREKTTKENMDMAEEIHCHVGIAHTRWATHGEPSDVNSHPHPSSPDCQFAVIHNGIITNYRELRAFLVRGIINFSSFFLSFVIMYVYRHTNWSYYLQESKGHVFVSETDTEVVAKLVQYFYNADANKQKNFRELVEQVKHQKKKTHTHTYAHIFTQSHAHIRP